MKPFCRRFLSLICALALFLPLLTVSSAAKSTGTIKDWAPNNYNASGNYLHTVLTATNDGALQVNGKMKNGLGEVGITRLEPVDLTTGFSFVLSFDQYTVTGTNGADSWLALMLSDKPRHTDYLNELPVYQKMQAGAGNPECGAGLVMLIRPQANNELMIGETYYNGVRFSATEVQRVTCFDHVGPGVYSRIRVSDLHNVKIAVLPDTKGGIRIVFNDGDFVRLDGERTDSDGSVNPQNRLANLNRLFNASTPCYLQLAYFHNQNTPVQFSVKQFNGAPAAVPIPLKEYQVPGAYSLFPALDLNRGFAVSGLNSAEEYSIPRYTFLYNPAKDAGYRPNWKISQWNSGTSLRDETKTAYKRNADGSYTVSNDFKTVSYSPKTGILTMRLNASAYYKAPRKNGESWPHLLLSPVSDFYGCTTPDYAYYPSNCEEMRLQLSCRLTDFTDYMGSRSNPNLHAAQLLLYLYVKGFREDGTTAHMWFGIPIFDNRTQHLAEGGMIDSGQQNASGEFIYALPTRDTMHTTFVSDTGEVIPSRDWVDIDVDIIPYLHRALQLAQKNGFFTGITWDNLVVTGMNLGFELPGTYDVECDFRDLKLTAYVGTQSKTNNGFYSFLGSELSSPVTVTPDKKVSVKLSANQVSAASTDVVCLSFEKDAVQTGELDRYTVSVNRNGERQNTYRTSIPFTYTPSAPRDDLQFYRAENNGLVRINATYRNGSYALSLDRSMTLVVKAPATVDTNPPVVTTDAPVQTLPSGETTLPANPSTDPEQTSASDVTTAPEDTTDPSEQTTSADKTTTSEGPPDPVPETTNPPAQTTVSEEESQEKSGCGSALALPCILPLVGAAFLLFRKRR